ncbi:MAG TPA: lysylphosphatidylglycerol synthase transmembrane domain-containing protein, partial [Candidatus Acidoferrales bacterium]|nr:lysylphosphatidylglycerol synthase transmembrane domain-containing protein [Candidatus Acidoferrales bacterium]
MLADTVKASNSSTVEKNALSGSSWLGLALRVGGSALALLILFHFLPLAEVWRTIRRLPPHLWLLLVIAYLCAHLVAITKWRMMVNLAGARLTFRQAVRCYFSGLFGTLFLPSIVGGDVVRAALAFRIGQSKAAIILGGLTDRILDFVALVFLAALGAVLIPGTLPAEARRIFVTGGIALLIVAALITPVVLWFPARKISFALRRRAIRLRRAARSMRSKPQYVAIALCLGLFAQGSFIWLTSRAADATGLHLLFRAWLFAWPLAKFCGVIPITQGGIGVREAALVILLVPFGAPPVETAAVGLAWEAVIICGG